MRAEVSPSLTYSGFVDRLPARGAWIVGLLIDLEMVLKISAPVDPIDTGSVRLNPLREGDPDGFEQPGCVMQVERFTGLEGVDAGSEKRFIRVDISHSSQKTLIQ